MLPFIVLGIRISDGAAGIGRQSDRKLVVASAPFYQRSLRFPHVGAYVIYVVTTGNADHCNMFSRFLHQSTPLRLPHPL